MAWVSIGRPARRTSMLRWTVSTVAIVLAIAAVWCGPGAAFAQANCCAMHPGAGCEVPDCQTCVCDTDSACCDPGVGWDQICVAIAEDECGTRCPCESCCAPQGAAGCNDDACESCVCEVDPPCCSEEFGWDDTCVQEAFVECAAACPCEPEGDCCTAHGGVGCEDFVCQACVCGLDATCCSEETGWDATCVSVAEAECLQSCLCPTDGDCCAVHGGPGCDDRACQACVCAGDAGCCSLEVGWDEICVTEATENCSEVCACEPARGCCDPHDTPGCADGGCEQCVCALDATCCNAEFVWDETCVSIASAECLAPCFCPTQGPCCAGNGDIGCNQGLCVECVCSRDEMCCTLEWDETCAEEARGECATSCHCPLVSDCCYPHEGGGCEDAACQGCVCGRDNFCCMETFWDATCADIANEECAASCACEACVGDCDGDGVVSVWELVTGVNVALGLAPLEDCFLVDVDADGVLTINELLAAVNDALFGC